MQPTQASGSPVTPVSAVPPNGTFRPSGPSNGTPSVSSFPRTNQFTNQPTPTTPGGNPISPAPNASGFPKTTQFTGQAPPSSAALTPGFPKTNQFLNPTPTTPLMTPGFPKTNMFANNNTSAATTPVTPGFPKTGQFVGVSSPLSAGNPGTGSFSSFPRTSQFLSGQPPRPLSAGGGSTNGTPDGSQYNPNTPTAANGLMSPGYQTLPSGPSTPIRSPLSQSQAFPSQSGPYQQPALPSQIQQQQQYNQLQQQQLQQQLQQQQNVDPLGGGSRIISNQPTPSALPTLPHTPTRMAASISGLPSRTNSMTSQGPTAVDPLMGGGMLNGGNSPMSQSMFVTPTSPYGPLGSAGLETGPLGGTVRARAGTPTRSRLDAREAASKLANFL